jgi:transient receptor potential cation channel subfamily V member 6
LIFYVDWNSALFIILNGTKEEHLDMLDGGIIQRLLEEKWKTFAQVHILYFIHVIFNNKGLQLIFFMKLPKKNARA